MANKRNKKRKTGVSNSGGGDAVKRQRLIEKENNPPARPVDTQPSAGPSRSSSFIPHQSEVSTRPIEPVKGLTQMRRGHFIPPTKNTSSAGSGSALLPISTEQPNSILISIQTKRVQEIVPLLVDKQSDKQSGGVVTEPAPQTKSSLPPLKPTRSSQRIKAQFVPPAGSSGILSISADKAVESPVNLSDADELDSAHSSGSTFIIAGEETSDESSSNDKNSGREDGNEDDENSDEDGNSSTTSGSEDGNNDRNSSTASGSEEGDEDEENVVSDGETGERASRMRNQDSSKKTRQKRRMRQSLSAERQARKSARNRGEAYTTAKGKEVHAKAPKGLEGCKKKKCFEKVPSETLPLLCSGLWQGLGDHDKRSSFVASLVDRKPKASQKLDCSSPSRRKPRLYSYKYFLPVNGERVEVCKACFMKAFAISSKFIEISIMKKFSNPAAVVSTDGRDGLLIAQSQTDSARNNLTIKLLYDEYTKQCSTSPVSRWIFDKEFHEMGLKIKPYKIDTCNTCDKLAAQVMYASNEEERELKLQEQKAHHITWEAAQKRKSEDAKEAKRNNKVEVVVFDLQQCLPTPHLQTSVVFYKRQLWVYNLTLHTCSNDKSVHSMWHEGEGERGPNQVGSALYHFLISLPDEVEHVVLWSDTCGGQNKNSIITATIQTILQHKQSLKTIDQKFLTPGHTHLECDKDHAVIEAKKKQASHIFVPRDWFNLVATANKRFTLKRLTQDSMLNFKGLLKGRDSPLVKRIKDESGNTFSWKRTVWMRHSRTYEPGQVAFKHSFDNAEEFKFLNLKRRKAGPLTLQPGLAYDGPVPISTQKKRDLLSLLYLIDPECHNFYHNLLSTDDMEDIDPDIPVSSDEEESDNE